MNSSNAPSLAWPPSPCLRSSSPVAARTTPQIPAQLSRVRLRHQWRSGTLTVIDVVNVRVDRELPVGLNPSPSRQPHQQRDLRRHSGAEAHRALSLSSAQKQHYSRTIPVRASRLYRH